MLLAMNGYYTQKAEWQHKHTTKIFDYLAIANWLITFSRSNDSQSVVEPVHGISTFPLIEKALLLEGHPF